MPCLDNKFAYIFSACHVETRHALSLQRPLPSPTRPRRALPYAECYKAVGLGRGEAAMATEVRPTLVGRCPTLNATRPLALDGAKRRRSLLIVNSLTTEIPPRAYGIFAAYLRKFRRASTDFRSSCVPLPPRLCDTPHPWRSRHFERSEKSHRGPGSPSREISPYGRNDGKFDPWFPHRFPRRGSPLFLASGRPVRAARTVGERHADVSTKT